MTFKISWNGVDYKKGGKSVSSLYITSDSRHSWRKFKRYDYGKASLEDINFERMNPETLKTFT